MLYEEMKKHAKNNNLIIEEVRTIIGTKVLFQRSCRTKDMPNESYRISRMAFGILKKLGAVDNSTIIKAPLKTLVK